MLSATRAVKAPSTGPKLFNKNLKLFSGRKLSTTSGTFPSYLVNIPPTKVTSLPNRMRVATEECFAETATVGVYIDSGSVYETTKNNGVAHFLEHMFFKGTNKRSKRDLEVEIENLGATLNAYTSREQTCYYMKVFKKDIEKGVEILSDIVTNSKLDPAHIEAERGTILREMEEVGKDYNEVVFDHLHAAAFQGTPLANTILGPEENIKSIKKDDLQSFINTHYHAPRMVVAAAGGVKHDELSGLAQKYFTNLPNDPKATDPVIELARQKPRFTGSEIRIRDDSMDLVHFAIAAEGVSWSHPDYYTFMVIQQIVGSWDRTLGGGKNLSSKLCETVATEELAHSISSFNTCYSNTGLFGVYATCEAEKSENLIWEILREWNRIGKNALDSEVERAKNKLKSTILMSLDGNTAVAEDIGRSLLTVGRRLSPAEIFLRIDAVKTQDVMRVAGDHFEDVDVTVAAVGPLENFPDYNMIREWTYWRRW